MEHSVDILNFNVFSDTSTSLAVSESPLSGSSRTSSKLWSSPNCWTDPSKLSSVSSSVDLDLQSKTVKFVNKLV